MIRSHVKYRTLRDTGIEVSTVGFGLWTVSTGWWGIDDERHGLSLLRRAYDSGVTFFDTADTYGQGKGETMLADALGGVRERIVIATKVGYDFYNHSNERDGHRELPQDFSPKHVRFAVEESLKRLRTDYIDVYQIHNPRMWAVRSDELFSTLEDLKTEGKVRCYGAALGPAIGWEPEGLALINDREIDTLQIIHNMLEQDPGRSLIGAAQTRDVSVFVRVPHSSGLLEGKYTADTTFSPNDHRSHRSREWLTEGLQKLEKLTFLTEDTGRTIAQAAIQFVLSSPAVASALPNVYDSEQLDEFIAAAEIPPLEDEELDRIAVLYERNFDLAKEPARR
jgi:aryl-alcohol dehydrogenase-like predicted oxidoreductase